MCDMYKITDHILEKYYGLIQGSIQIPSSVQIIGEGCFAGTEIEEICIPKCVIEISNRAFNKCQKLHTVIFEESSQLQRIGRYAFSECDNLKTIVIPTKVKKVEQGTFAFCKRLTNITLPMSLDEIHENAFDNCTSLDIISLPETLKNIGKEAFYKCDSLSEVVFPQNNRKIPAACCFSCRSLKRVVILSEWHSTSIEKNAFGSCEDLQEVVLNTDVFFNNLSEFKRMTNYANIRFVSLDNKLLSEA